MASSKDYPCLPPNYVTFRQLQERWEREQQLKQSKKEEEKVVVRTVEEVEAELELMTVQEKENDEEGIWVLEESNEDEETISRLGILPSENQTTKLSYPEHKNSQSDVVDVTAIETFQSKKKKKKKKKKDKYNDKKKEEWPLPEGTGTRNVAKIHERTVERQGTQTAFLPRVHNSAAYRNFSRKGIRTEFHAKINSSVDQMGETMQNMENLAMNCGKEGTEVGSKIKNNGNRRNYRGFNKFDSRWRKPRDVNMVWVKKGEVFDGNRLQE